MRSAPRRGFGESTRRALRFYTPPKYWSADLQQRMFANKTAFAMLRDRARVMKPWKRPRPLT